MSLTFTKKVLFIPLLALIGFNHAYGTPSQVELSVWANEAIIATYTYDAKTILEAQKGMAKYFTTEAWIAYIKALNASNLLDTVKANAYEVSAVATRPPKIIALDSKHWQATMPILVSFKNASQEQLQNLKLSLNFMETPAGLGVRGLSITSIMSTEISPPCICPSIKN